MELTIDIGNTLSKAALFEHNKIIKKVALGSNLTASLRQLFSKYPVNAAIVSSVRKYPTGAVKLLESRTKLIQLSHTTKIPLKNRYRSATLGTDRIAAACGAAYLFPRKDLLVIDAGTCITYDVVTRQGIFQGGSISPGLQMRFDALHHFTGKLPSLRAGKFTSLPAITTENSMISGVQQGIVFEIEGFIRHYQKKYGAVTVVMGGGDAELFAGRIKSSIFAAPDLIHLGLYTILKLNV